MDDRGERSGRRRGLTDLYTVGEAAAVLGVSRKRVFEWIEAEVLAVVQLGAGQQMMRIHCMALKRFIEEDFRPSVPPGQGGSLCREAQESIAGRMGEGAQDKRT